MDPLGERNIPFYRNDENLSPQKANAHLELLIISESKATRHLISETKKHTEREMISIVEYVRKKNQKTKLKVKKLESRMEELERRMNSSTRIEQTNQFNENCTPRIQKSNPIPYKLRSQTTESNYSSRRLRSSSRDLSRSKINERVDPIVLTEVQIQALMKGKDCVKFIGELLFSSFPEGYFLESNNTFARAVSSENMDAFFEIVSNKYKKIKRFRHPQKPLTMKDMYEVMRNKVYTYRTKNRRFLK